MGAELIDPVCVPDIFATEMVSVEDLGGVFRFTFAAVHGRELILVNRVCMLTSAVPGARRLTAAAVAQSTNPLLKALNVHH